MHVKKQGASKASCTSPKKSVGKDAEKDVDSPHTPNLLIISPLHICLEVRIHALLEQTASFRALPCTMTHFDC